MNVYHFGGVIEIFAGKKSLALKSYIDEIFPSNYYRSNRIFKLIVTYFSVFRYMIYFRGSVIKSKNSIRFDSISNQSKTSIRLIGPLN